MKIRDAFKTASLVAFDTTPIIYFIETNPTYIMRMRHIMQMIAHGDINGCASYLALTEVLIHPLKSGNTHLAQQYEKLLGQSNNFTLITISRSIALEAANLRASYNLKTPDALHVASAIASKADIFLTNDKGIKRVQEIDVILIDELDL